MPIYRWLCSHCRSAYILPRQQKHNHNHWRCYSCNKVFSDPYEAGTMMWDDHFETPLKARKPDNWAEIVGNYSGPYRFPEEMMLYPEKPLRQKPNNQPRRKRNRATALVVNDGKLLLVRERGSRRYSLPGGGMERGESPVTSACREVDEETSLKVLEATFLFNYEGQTQNHHVCLLSAEGKVRLQRKELSESIWWDGRKSLPMLPSVEVIIERAKASGLLMIGISSDVR